MGTVALSDAHADLGEAVARRWSIAWTAGTWAGTRTHLLAFLLQLAIFLLNPNRRPLLETRDAGDGLNDFLLGICLAITPRLASLALHPPFFLFDIV